MGTRVLGAENWYHPGSVGAACDARVIVLHAAHVRGAGGVGCAATRAKGGGLGAAAPGFQSPPRKSKAKTEAGELEDGTVGTLSMSTYW